MTDLPREVVEAGRRAFNDGVPWRSVDGQVEAIAHAVLDAAVAGISEIALDRLARHFAQAVSCKEDRAALLTELKGGKDA